MDNILTFFDSVDVLSIFIKLFGIVLMLIYLVFAFILQRQVVNLKKTVQVGDKGFVNLIAQIHLGIAILIFWYAVLFL